MFQEGLIVTRDQHRFDCTIENVSTPSLENPFVSLIVPACESSSFICDSLENAHLEMDSRFGPNFEIIVIANGAETEATMILVQEFIRKQAKYSNIRILKTCEKGGKGAALKKGVRSAKGSVIFFTDSDLPYDFEFFDMASSALKDGVSLVTGSRRLKSHFVLDQSRFFEIANIRPILGQGFNKLIRLLLPIDTLDTQAGIKAMTRSFADLAFSKQICSSYYFDIELFLSAQSNGMKVRELPVKLRNRSSSSSIRVHREFFSAVFWLLKITYFFRMGYYRRDVILSRYIQVHGFLKLFIWLRWTMTPFQKISAYVPLNGKILDLGCGHGLFSMLLACQSNGREVIGVDHDCGRIRLAQTAAQGLDNVQFKAEKIQDSINQVAKLNGTFASIVLLDTIHYFSSTEQQILLKQCYDALSEGGIFVLRNIEPSDGFRAIVNRIYEKIANVLRFTKADSSKFCFRTSQEWILMLNNLGFDASAFRCSHPLLSDVLFVCKKSG